MKTKKAKNRKKFLKLYFFVIVIVIMLSVIIGYEVNSKKSTNVATSVNLQGSSTATIDNNNIEAIETQPKVVNPSDEIIYLSDIDYIDIDRTTKDNTSYTGWGSIQKNKNVEGNTIRLKREGEIISYSKGMGIHANRTINI